MSLYLRSETSDDDMPFGLCCRSYLFILPISFSFLCGSILIGTGEAVIAAILSICMGERDVCMYVCMYVMYYVCACVFAPARVCARARACVFAPACVELTICLAAHMAD
ncbi:hypothetical protein M6B38_320515 [Iris pallida]|uniref:Uncharacterized protein n=1 Tax=Iris pallida TaxID=29817 RepID=A0AAX6DTF8_IRIPA|nr:hypothetical protein M6B38_226970 [Iris pallida]KAJ6795080.1 hypothetical protein M6B38_226975 [Iris pallida]KAJ6838384.1 hypothetical protein M6B38_320510 [Iris pallida]KAJ6838385.1 hypothetical protein M6B38_320515 [Iris pallida]